MKTFLLYTVLSVVIFLGSPFVLVGVLSLAELIDHRWAGTLGDLLDTGVRPLTWLSILTLFIVPIVHERGSRGEAIICFCLGLAALTTAFFWVAVTWLPLA